ncbi:hypothetical protein OTB20_36120 [Streptomyces sp. H27-H1]|uniref:hypothetical protein n=1 Tax=Streptomyces sp. H27-H1 TaxID=2996461 RepID=UPI00226F6CA2|nr:hypothetical protein [Streptomyces sp. H27-H1]MCY0931519.1 hypothetical protein [Streptomyces sp. H27-H1]
MTDLVEPDVLYGHTPGSAHPLWVAVLKDIPNAIAVLERHSFRRTTINDLELFTLPRETSTQLSTVLHVASYAELVHADYVTMHTADHPALPAERLDGVMALGLGQSPAAAPVQGSRPSGLPATPPTTRGVPDTFRRPPTRGGGS